MTGFLDVLIALTAIIIAGRVLALLFRYIGQPPVIGEVFAGILLGPSFLGAELSGRILAPAAAPFLAVVAQLGIVLYMFLVGLELDPAPLRTRARAAAATSIASIVVPFVLGLALAWPLHPMLADGVPFTTFALFMGVAMSITAFPVLARILAALQMTRTSIGVLALTCAAVNDVAAWCLLAVVVGIANAEAGSGLLVSAGAAAFVAAMFFAVRPLLGWVLRRSGRGEPSEGDLAIVFIVLLLCALAAEVIGIHAIFGAFLLGAIIPHDAPVAGAMQRQLEPVVVILMLPAFFALTGMRTRIDLIATTSEWMMCAAIVAVAVAGKIGGTFAAARLTGIGARESATLGVLMNTRGLMELIVLNVGLELGVISPTLFSMMVVMALVTTAITSPLVRVLLPERRTAMQNG